jgi:hypothetical protein
MVVNIKSVVAHKEVVSNSARRALRTSSCVLREPYRQVGLAGVRIFGEQCHDIVELPIFIHDTSIRCRASSTVLIGEPFTPIFGRGSGRRYLSGETRPVSFHIVVVELSSFIEKTLYTCAG